MKIRNTRNTGLFIGDGRVLEPGKVADVKKDLADWDKVPGVEVIKAKKKDDKADNPE